MSTGAAPRAQAPPEPPGDVTALAKTTQNPVGDLISLLYPERKK